MKKRKVFNSKAHRVVDPEQIKIQKEAEKSSKTQAKPTKAKGKTAEDKPINGTGANMPKWKIQSLQFR